MEKKQPVETTRSVSEWEQQEHDNESQQIVDPNWQPGFWKRFPWIGFGALVMVLLCSAASVIVLETCNGKSETFWPSALPPNVLLNAFNSVAGLCFAITIGNGVAIGWWRRTLRGSSIADLHRSWSFSTSLKEIAFSLKYFNVVALATLAAKLTIIDGTLMQDALTFYQDLDTRPTQVNVTGYTETSFPYTGYVENSQGDAGVMMPIALQTLQMWEQTSGTYPNKNFHGCDQGVCYVNVPGVGFRFDCPEPTTVNVDYGHTLSQEPAGASVTLFEINFETVYYDERPSGVESAYLRMNASWNLATFPGSEGSCPSTKQTMSCRLIPSVINYPVQIQSVAQTQVMSIGPTKDTGADFAAYWASYVENPNKPFNADLVAFDSTTGQQEGFEILRPIRVEETRPFGTNDHKMTHLSGIQLALTTAFAGRADLSLDRSFGNRYVLNTTGRAETWLQMSPGVSHECGYGFWTPLQAYSSDADAYVIPTLPARINQIMFGLATDVCRTDYDVNVDGKDVLKGWQQRNQSEAPVFPGPRYAYSVHYKMRPRFMWGAVAATICCVLLVLPVYWGFWELGRKVSLNPFEIAHAFRSPMLNDASNGSPEVLIKEVGDQPVRYGPVVLSGPTYGRFGVAAPHNVASPPGIRPNPRFA